MKLKLGLYIYILFFGISYAQVGINTENPKSTLHLAASSNSHPTGEDGIIIPRVNEFPIGQEKGHLFFLKGNSSHQTGFYYYDGKDWESFLVDGLDRTVDESIYVFMGTGFINETPGLTKTVILNQYAIPINSDDWSLANNQIKVGKSGKYLMMFNSSLKRPIPTSGVQGRSTFVFEVVKNGQSTVLSGATSTANEESTAIGISMSNLVEWRKLGSFFFNE